MVNIEGTGDGYILVNGELDGILGVVPEGEHRLLALSDGSMVRCAHTEDGWRMSILREGDGRWEQYIDDEGNEFLEGNSVVYEWAALTEEVIHALS